MLGSLASSAYFSGIWSRSPQRVAAKPGMARFLRGNAGSSSSRKRDGELSSRVAVAAFSEARVVQDAGTGASSFTQNGREKTVEFHSTIGL